MWDYAHREIVSLLPKFALPDLQHASMENFGSLLFSDPCVLGKFVWESCDVLERETRIMSL